MYVEYGEIEFLSIKITEVDVCMHYCILHCNLYFYTLLKAIIVEKYVSMLDMHSIRTCDSTKNIECV